jgi:hypothetical protein
MIAKTRTRRWVRFGSVALVCLMSLSTVGSADIFTGTMTSDSGLTGFGGWATGASLTWTVDDTTTAGLWHYEYELTVAEKDISHLIIETSPTFVDEPDVTNLFNLSWTGGHDVDTFGGSGDPGISDGDIYGLKIDEVSTKSLLVTFDSDRAPVWGDFYAKDGTEDKGTVDVYLYNDGFFDADPIAPLANGPLDGHLLVPDTISVVPVPSAVLLGAMGLGISGQLLRRKKKRA